MKLSFRFLLLFVLAALVAVSAGAQTLGGHFNGQFTLLRGTWATASPDGSPVVLFDVGTEEIYRLKWRPR